MNLMIFTTLLALLGAIGLGTPKMAMSKTPTPHISAPKQLLAPPASYDYIYQQSAITDLFTLSDDTLATNEVIVYTRSSGLSGWNYAVTGKQSTVLPTGLTFTIQWQDSNTTWTPVVSPSIGYVPESAYVGADDTVGSQNKFSMIIYNNTTNDFTFYYDFIASYDDNIDVLLYPDTTRTNPTHIFGNYYDNDLSTEQLTTFTVRAYTDAEIRFNPTADPRYVDAFYIKNLGLNEAYDTGLDDGTQIGYTAGFNAEQNPVGLIYNTYADLNTSLAFNFVNITTLEDADLLYAYVTGSPYNYIYANFANSDKRILLNGYVGTNIYSVNRASVVNGNITTTTIGAIFSFAHDANIQSVSSWTLDVKHQNGLSFIIDSDTFDNTVPHETSRGSGIRLMNYTGMLSLQNRERGWFYGQSTTILDVDYTSDLDASTKFMLGLQTWIVPVIFIVIVGGGIIYMIKRKNQQAD